MTHDLVDQQQLSADVLDIKELLAQPDTSFEVLQDKVLHTLGPCTIGDELTALAARPDPAGTQQALAFFDDVARAIDHEGFYGWISRMLATVSVPYHDSYTRHGPTAAETHTLRMEIDDICRMGAYVLLTNGYKTELNQELIKQFLQGDHVHLMTASLPKVCSDLGLGTFLPRDIPLEPTHVQSADPIHIPYTPEALATDGEPEAVSSISDSTETSSLPQADAPAVPWSGSAQQILFEVEMLRMISHPQENPEPSEDGSLWQDAEFRSKKLQRIAGPRLMGPGLAHAFETHDDLARARGLLVDIQTIVSAGGPLALAPALTEDAFENLTALRVDLDGAQSEAARQWVRQACADAAFVVMSWGHDLHQTWSLAGHLLVGDLSSYGRAIEPLFESSMAQS